MKTQFKSKKSLVLLVAVLAMVMLFAVGCGADTPVDTPAPAPATDEAKPVEEIAWQYYTADQLKEAIEAKAPIYLLDIQPEDAYKEHHIVGAVPTYAYPADTPELTAKIDAVVADLKATTNPIIVVCPGGGGGAKNTITYLSTQGIPVEQMFILENGQKGWPHADLLEK